MHNFKKTNEIVQKSKKTKNFACTIKSAGTKNTPLRCYAYIEKYLHLDLSCYFFHHEGFQDVALLDVVEAVESNTALVSLRYLAHVVLEAAQGGYLILGNNNSVTHNSDACASRYLSVLNIASCYRSDT